MDEDANNPVDQDSEEELIENQDDEDLVENQDDEDLVENEDGEEELIENEDGEDLMENQDGEDLVENPGVEEGDEEQDDESQNVEDEENGHILQEGDEAGVPPGSRFFEEGHEESFDEGRPGFVEDGDDETEEETETDEPPFPNNDGDEGGMEEEGDDEGGLIIEEGGAESGDGEVPPVDSDEIAMMQMLLPDTESLYDVSAGFNSESNVKVPMAGFSSAYQDYFFPLIDSQSGILFEIVQEVERAVYKSNEDILRGMKEPVAIPACRLAVKNGGPEIRLRIMDPSEPLTSVEPTIPAPPSTVAKGGVAALGWQKTKKSPETMELEKQITPAEKAFSEEKLKKLMIPFSHGWKREIVIRSQGGGASKKLGDVYYFSPEGTKYRSSKQVALFLNKQPALKMSVENFSFAKARVSYDPLEESVRAAQGGRGLNPVKNQQTTRVGAKGSESIEDDDESESTSATVNGGLDSPVTDPNQEGAVKSRGGRRSIQPPKRYATAEFIPEVPKRAKISSQKQDKDTNNYSGGGMQMGMLHPKYRGIEVEAMEEEKTGEQMLQEFRARRGRPPKGNSLTGSPQPQQQIHYATSPQHRGRGRGGMMHSGRVHQLQQQSREDGPMFGIAALTQGAQFSNYAEGLEYSSALSSMDSDGYEGDVSVDVGEDGSFDNDKSELLPCSIRCPGMTGEIPTLQCKRCLCLYHPGCLGLPNQPYRNFYCSNCEGGSEGGGGGASSSGSSPNQKPEQQQRAILASKGGMRLMKRSEPPGLIQLNNNFSGMGGKTSIFASGAPPGVRRILPKIPNLQGSRPQQGQQQGGMRGGIPPLYRGINPPQLIRPGMHMQMMGQRRGRGRPPRGMGMSSTGPNMTRGSVTITPISIPRGGRGGHHPVVPRLQPMSIPSSGSFMGRGGQMSQRGSYMQQHQTYPGQQMRTRGPGRPPSFMSTSPQQMQLLRRGGLAPRPRTPSPLNIRLPARLRGSSIFNLDSEGRIQPRASLISGLVTELGNSGVTVSSSTGQFQRYAQSVVTINQKKYLALPKNSSGAGSSSAQKSVMPLESPTNPESELKIDEAATTEAVATSEDDLI